MRTRLVLLALLLTGALIQASPYLTFETITVAGTAVGFTASTIDPPGYPQMTTCMGRLETGEIRYDADTTLFVTAPGELSQPIGANSGGAANVLPTCVYEIVPPTLWQKLTGQTGGIQLPRTISGGCDQSATTTDCASIVAHCRHRIY